MLAGHQEGRKFRNAACGGGAVKDLGTVGFAVEQTRRPGQGGARASKGMVGVGVVAGRAPRVCCGVMGWRCAVVGPCDGLLTLDS